MAYAPAAGAVYTVGQVTAYLKDKLEGDPLLADLTVEAEVSNFRVSGAGHGYFTLKDDTGVLNCVMFRNRLTAGRNSQALAEGSAVLAYGRITFYEPRGSVDFMVDAVAPAGMGALALKLEELRTRLESEGLFDESRKRPLPPFPRAIGVVTSPSGAVFHDIRNVIGRRYPLAELILSPARVQGDGAARDIVAAIGALNDDGRAGVIIVARGGGSLEDLWPFNEEAVARAIYASRIPVVSGVGHETDFTIADYTADRRAPTPSAAAELVVPDRAELKRQLAGAGEFLRRSMTQRLGDRRAGVDALARRLERSLPDASHNRRLVDDLAHRLERSLPDVPALRRRLDETARQAGAAMFNRLKFARLAVENGEERLRALDPTATLRRGFAVVRHRDSGELVAAKGRVADGDPLTITVADGDIPAVAGASADPKPPPPEPRRAGRKRNSTKQAPAMERLL